MRSRASPNRKEPEAAKAFVAYLKPGRIDRPAFWAPYISLRVTTTCKSD